MFVPRWGARLRRAALLRGRLMVWNSTYIAELVERALAEDVGPSDVTVAATIPPNATARARILAKQDMVCAGLPLTGLIFRKLDPQMIVQEHAKDGQLARNGDVLLRLSGKAAAILTGERTALNFLGQLSSIATLTHRFT